MRRTLRVLNQLKAKGVIKDYAIGGGIGAIFYIEPVLTYDLDVFVVLQETKQKGLILLAPVFDYLREKGYSWVGEHILIEGFPVQFIPADKLEEEAIEDAIVTSYQGTRIKVMCPEYLIALFVRAGRAKDITKVRMLLTQTRINKVKLHSILSKYGLSNKFELLQRKGLI